MPLFGFYYKNSKVLIIFIPMKSFFKWNKSEFLCLKCYDSNSLKAMFKHAMMTAFQSSQLGYLRYVSAHM